MAYLETPQAPWTASRGFAAMPGSLEICKTELVCPIRDYRLRQGLWSHQHVVGLHASSPSTKGASLWASRGPPKFPAPKAVSTT
eukprot:scaffold240545_cov36-Tisochrysis_lutea.AAC.2